MKLPTTLTVNRLENKVAIVTGGASGMGAAIALLFAQEGAAVVIGDIEDTKAHAVASRIRGLRGQAIALRTDVVDEQQVKTLVRSVIKQFKTIDILVNCVGLAEFVSFENITVRQWRRILDVNLTGAFLCCREAGKVMIRRKTGTIVNFASTGGLSGVPYMAHYTAAKHGVVGLTRALAVEWGKYNVRVNCICPGATVTPMLLGQTSATYRANRAKRIPLQRLGMPADQAAVALFLAAAESDYVTGSVVCVDGGAYAMSPATDQSALAGKA